MFKVQEVDDVTLAFPGKISHLCPNLEDIPDEYKDLNGKNKWVLLQERWFFEGLVGVSFIPKAGVDAEKAFRHLAAIQGSFEPKHEHKMAYVSFLFSEWFEDAIDENARSLITGKKVKLPKQ